MGQFSLVLHATMPSGKQELDDVNSGGMQGTRADHTISGSRQQQLEAVRADIRGFKASSGAERVVVLWTANTERYSEVGPLGLCSVRAVP